MPMFRLSFPGAGTGPAAFRSAISLQPSSLTRPASGQHVVPHGRLAGVGLFKRRGSEGPPGLVDLRLAADVAGLVRALEYNAPAVVKEAAEAIGHIRQSEGEPASSQAGQTGPELLGALARMSAQADAPLDPTTLLAATDADFATWTLIDTLGQIQCKQAGPVLAAIVADATVSPVRREHAARALGSINGAAAVVPLAQLLRDPRIERAVVIPQEAADLANAAAEALSKLGEAGVSALCSAATADGDVSRRAIQALRSVGPDEPGAATARAAVEAFDVAATAARRSQQAARAAQEASDAAQRRTLFPQAAALADRVGHPEWLTDQGVLAPDSYSGALEACRSLGLGIDEHEEVCDNEMSDVWATVTVDGALITVLGGRRFRDVLY